MKPPTTKPAIGKGATMLHTMNGQKTPSEHPKQHHYGVVNNNPSRPLSSSSNSLFGSQFGEISKGNNKA